MVKIRAGELRLQISGAIACAPDEQGNDLFVHHLSIAGSGFNSLAEGAKVSYDAEQGPKARPPRTYRRLSDCVATLDGPP